MSGCWKAFCQFGAEANWILDTVYYHTGLLPQSWDGDGILSMLHVPGENAKLTAFIKAHRHLPTVDLSMNDSLHRAPRVSCRDNPGIGKAGSGASCCTGGVVIWDLSFMNRIIFIGNASTDFGKPQRRWGLMQNCSKRPAIS